MIFKLQTPYTYARHKEEKVVKPLTHKDRVNADRLVMLILLVIAITTAVIFA